MDGFERFLGLLDYPVYVVTAQSSGERAGCLVGFAGQSSITPARFVVWISKVNHTHAVALRARVLAVHLLRDRALAELFGGRTGDEVDKFAAVRWQRGPDGVPLLTDVPASFVGRVLDRADRGDHTSFLLAPASGLVLDPAADVLTLHDVAGIDPGHPA
ncbi:flavin reductase [Streptomyces sp. CB01881]|uniref:flavin reductase family protein n=1 Tax=Streptomyces sp. CB01881 TaxID=2078691 RepID=UPI0011DF4F74|nr:flavin reductase family protein [Streptomyces sp. CB01881]TYC66731.1 flavin reductase [Streptomyces sp. CB01881]